jgi:hypothetical protein
VARGSVETGHTRALTTVFGEVRVTRLAYRRRGHANLYPADAQLNLPVEKHSHGLRKLAAVPAARGSFEDTADAIERATGVRWGKCQVEQLAGRAAADVEDFYAQRRPPTSAGRDVLALSVDGKGIVMRPEALRPATAKAAASATTKLTTRLSKGEKRNRKRLAEVGAVYDADPVVRTPADILARGQDTTQDTTQDTNPEQPAKAPVALVRHAALGHADGSRLRGRPAGEARRGLGRNRQADARHRTAHAGWLRCRPHRSRFHGRDPRRRGSPTRHRAPPPSAQPG